MEVVAEMGKDLAIAIGILETDILDADAERTANHLSGRLFLFRLHLFQIFQTIDAGRGMDSLWQHVEHLENGLLDLADELKERSHHTKSDGTGTQLHGTPDESYDIAKTETR